MSKYNLDSISVNHKIQKMLYLIILFAMKMKKVNKQYLLDTPRTVRVSKKNLSFGK